MVNLRRRDQHFSLRFRACFFLKCETKTETPFICQYAARFCHSLVILMALKNIEAKRVNPRRNIDITGLDG